MSDLLNDPGSLCGCEQMGCENACAWFEGTVDEVMARARAEYHDYQSDTPPWGASVSASADWARESLQHWWNRHLTDTYIEFGLPVPAHLDTTRSTAA